MLRWIVVPLPYVRDGHPVATVSEVVAVLPGAVQEHSIYLDGGEGVPETGGSAPKRGFHTPQPAFRHVFEVRSRLVTQSSRRPGRFRPRLTVSFVFPSIFTTYFRSSRKSSRKFVWQGTLPWSGITSRKPHRPSHIPPLSRLASAMARAGFPRRPLASALALALCLVGVSALVAPAPALAPGARAFAGAAHRRACARPPAARGRRRGLRTLVGYEPGGGTVMTPEQVAKVLETSADAPRLPACLSLEDRETRIRLAQILRQGTAVELIQQQFSDAVKDIGMHLGRDVSQALLKAEQEVGGKGFARLSSTNARLSSLNPDVLPPDLRPRKPRIVVLGSGWGAHAFVKVIDTSKFDVVAVSPRPYFIFTPMLASSAVGTVEYRSITEPMRSSNPLVEYFEAAALKIDAASKTVSFCPVCVCVCVYNRYNNR